MEPTILLGAATLAFSIILAVVTALNRRLGRMEKDHKDHAASDERRFSDDVPKMVRTEVGEAEKRMNILILQEIRVATAPFAQQIGTLTETLRREHEENREDRRGDMKEIRELVEKMAERRVVGRAAE